MGQHRRSASRPRRPPHHAFDGSSSSCRAARRNPLGPPTKKSRTQAIKGGNPATSTLSFSRPFSAAATASSAESVGEFWFGQGAKCVIQSDFQCPGGAEPIRPFGDHSGLPVEAFDNAGRSPGSRFSRVRHPDRNRRVVRQTTPRRDTSSSSWTPGELPPGSEPVQDQVAVRAHHAGNILHRFEPRAQLVRVITSGRGTVRPSTATR